MIRKPAAILFVLSLAVLALALVPAAGLAAKGGGNAGAGGKPSGGGGGGSGGGLTLVVLDPDDGGANYGEQVTFTVSPTSATDQPYVGLDCYQGGTLVYSASAGFFAGYPWPWNQTFSLGSSMWTSGAADCTATLEYWDGRRMRPLASIPVPVYA